MNTKEIRDLINFISKTGLEEVDIETEQIKLKVKRSAEIQTVSAPAQPTPAPASPPAVGDTTKAEPSVEKKAHLIEIKSPMIGTFYRAQNPDSSPFVNIGDTVQVGQTVCMVEAMKLFNEIESDVSGKIVEVLVDNAEPVQFDQPLFLVEPA